MENQTYSVPLGKNVSPNTVRIEHIYVTNEGDVTAKLTWKGKAEEGLEKARGAATEAILRGDFRTLDYIEAKLSYEYGINLAGRKVEN